VRSRSAECGRGRRSAAEVGGRRCTAGQLPDRPPEEAVLHTGPSPPDPWTLTSAKDSPLSGGWRVIRAPGLSTVRGSLLDTFWSSQIALRGVCNGVGCVLAIEITSLTRWFVPAGGGGNYLNDEVICAGSAGWIRPSGFHVNVEVRSGWGGWWAIPSRVLSTPGAWSWRRPPFVITPTGCSPRSARLG
jgi:hypothetical protein